MASKSEGKSPIPHAIVPPMAWSANLSGTQGTSITPKKPSARSVFIDIIATPKNAWNEIVTKSTTSRSDGAHLRGPGSVPTRTMQKR